MSQFEFVTSQSYLEGFCKNAATKQVLFLDTEFVRTRTLKPKLGLLQAFDGEQVVLIDPLCDIDLSPFWALLTDPNIVKVLHSCSEDLEVFKCYCGTMPTPLFDTQIAGAFLGEGLSAGYAALVEKLLGVSLDKTEARTNWLARPLSDKQLDYAAKDVIYLEQIYQKLVPALEAKGLLQHVFDEGELMIAKRNIDKDPERMYIDIKGAWRLYPIDLAVLKTLAAWRYKEACRRDLALNFIVKEPNLITIARNRPQDLNQLKSLPGMLPQEVRYHGNAILTHVHNAMALPPEQHPARLTRLVDYPNYKKAFKQLKDAVEMAADKSGIPVEAIASKRQINQVLSWCWKLDDCDRDERIKPDLMQGWRLALLGEALFSSL